MTETPSPAADVTLPAWIRSALTGPLPAGASDPDHQTAPEPDDPDPIGRIPATLLFGDLVDAAWERLPDAIRTHAAWAEGGRVGLRRALLNRIADLFRLTLEDNQKVCETEWRNFDLPMDAHRIWLDVMRGSATPDGNWEASGWNKLFENRPVFARLLPLILSQWAAATDQLVTAYGEDRAALAEQLFSGDDPGPCRGLKWGLSDPHGNGCAVAILSFADRPSGAVFKPRPLALDAAFAGVLAQLNADPTAPTDLRIAKVVDRGAYGWAEQILPIPCADRTEIDAFYSRAGALLALLHRLYATDFHAENVIASGAYPIPIDLETLWHPIGGPEMGAEPPTAEGALDTAMRLAIGRTPPTTHYISVGWNKNPEIGGMGGLDGLPDADHPHRDKMRSDNHLPRLSAGRDGIVEPDDHVDAILQGFESYSAFLVDHDALKPAAPSASDPNRQIYGPPDPPAAFVGLPARWVLRHTGSYQTRLDVLRRPAALVDDATWENAMAAPFPDRPYPIDHPGIKALIAAEHAAMRRMDVPAFYWHIGQPDIREADGTPISGLTPAQDQRQPTPGSPHTSGSAGRIIRSILHARYDAGLTIHGPALKPITPETLSDPLTPEAAEQEAIRLARQLAASALRPFEPDRLPPAEQEAARADWLAVISKGRGLDVGMDPLSLYAGLPGIVWFLAAVAPKAKDPEIDHVLAASLRRLQDRMRRPKDVIWQNLGAYSGFPGLAWALLALADMGQDASGQLGRHAEDLLLNAPEQAVAQDKEQDIIGGTTGAILVTLHAAERATERKEDLHTKAVALGHALLAQKRSHGLWGAAVGGPLTGLSHGVAGVALAFSKLFALSGDRAFKTAAQACLDFERGVFNARVPGWPDLRTDPPDAPVPSNPPHLAQWCHGSGGITLSRMALLSLTPDDAQLREEARLAAEITARNLPGATDDLCCGTFGRTLILEQAARYFSRPEWSDIARRCMATLVTRAQDSGSYRLQMGHHTESPGVMKGTAGIGLALLSLSSSPPPQPTLPGAIK